MGWRVDDLDGRVLGQVEEVIAGRDGEAAWLVLGQVALDGRRYLIPAYDAVARTGRLWCPHTRGQVRAIGGFEGRMTARADEQLRAHFAPARDRRAA
jgi:hypothetical protein